jgi:glucan 1,4-alpha-maltotetraohydrolase
VVWPTQQAIKWKCVIRSLTNVNEVYWQKDPDNSLTTSAGTEAVGSF